jgi:hypothetical protein
LGPNRISAVRGRKKDLNVALGSEHNPDRQQQILMFVDRFSATHLVILKFLNDPPRRFQALGQPVPQLNYLSQR